YNGWSWFDVDTVGGLGPQNEIVLVNAVGGKNNEVYDRIAADGSYVAPGVGDGAGRLAEGPGNAAGTVFAPLPIYSWVSAFSKTRSHFLGGGFRYFGLYGARPRPPSDPPIDINSRVGLNIDIFDKVSSSQAG